MLHKSFKPAKCKTSLKLAASRIKLLKNKKEVQIKQLRREVAQLIESGQVQTARIRVEHVVREEKTTGAYELIEIYCELIAARLPIIESQKNCPIDLKEAIASVVFTSPRCADIPELMDVRKHFLAKYGKDFINAAVELRPDCGVNRSLVGKLSAKTPDGLTKLKILTAIAEEHNIKWDPSSFGENNEPSPDDLLKGPSTFEKASRMHEEPPNFCTSPSVDVGSQKATNEENLRNFHARTSFGLQNVPRSPEHVRSPVNSHLETQSSGIIGEGSEARRGRCLGDASVNYVGRPEWNMEFADATAAAQAAAESAERASMAARAAAELSSRRRVTAHHAPDPHGFRDERLERPLRLLPPEEDLSRTQVNNASVGSKSRTPDERIDSREENPARDRNQYKSNPEVGSIFHGGPVSGDFATDSTVDRGASDTYSNQDDDSDDGGSLSGMMKKLHRVTYQKSSNSNGPDFGTAGKEVVYTETNPWSTELDNDDISDHRSTRNNSFEEVNTIGSSSEKHARKNSDESFMEYTPDMPENRPQSRTLHSSSCMEKQGLSSLDDRKEEDGLVENPFVDDNEERISMGDKTTGEGAVVFDDYGLDEDVESVFNLDKGPKSSHTISLLHVEAHLLEDSHIPSPGRITADSFKMNFAEAVPEDRAAPETEENLPVTFDDSDGLRSENEVEPEKSSALRESEHVSGVQKYSGLSEFAPVGEAEVVSDSGSRLAFENLSAGRRNQSHVPSLNSQSISGEDSLPNRRRDDHKTSDDDPDINYGGDQLEDLPIRRMKTNAVYHEVTVPQPRTHSRLVVYADDEEEFELDADYWKKPSTRPVDNDSEEKKRLSSVNDDAKEHPSRISSGRSRVGAPAGLSRRTKAGTSRDADAGENLANLRARTNTSDYSESHGHLKLRSKAKDDPVVEAAKASGEKDATGTSRPARPSLDSASSEDSFMQMSHVHPKMPQDYETLLANLQSLRANRQ